MISLGLIAKMVKVNLIYLDLALGQRALEGKGEPAPGVITLGKLLN